MAMQNKMALIEEEYIATNLYHKKVGQRQKKNKTKKHAFEKTGEYKQVNVATINEKL